MTVERRRPENAASVLLAAGLSRRMGAHNKLLEEIEPGVPVIRRCVERALACAPRPLYVVTGHEADRVRAALAGLDCRFAHNADFAEGLSGSIREGFRCATGEGASGVLVLLGDMPFLPVEAIDAVLGAAADDAEKVVQAVHEGRPAHPVWLPARMADTIDALKGDRGVRSLLADGNEKMVAVETGPDGALDLDTPEDMASARARTAGSGN